MRNIRHQSEGRKRGSMPNSPLIPSTTARYNEVPDFSLSLFCFGPEIFANSGMPGILIRARALFIAVFINLSGGGGGGEGPDFALKKKKKIKPNWKKKKKKGKPEKK